MKTLVDASEARREPLRVEVFFAEEGKMIGKEGTEWFNRCWEKGNPEWVIQYRSEVVPDANHDDILLSVSVMDRAMGAIVKSVSEAR